MKKLFVLISMTYIVIGISLSVQSVAPENYNGGKSNAIQAQASLCTPLANYDFYVIIDDADIDCPAQSCSLTIIVAEASNGCVVVGSDVDSKPYVPGTASYHFTGTTNAPYLFVYIYSSGTCNFNQNTCCVQVSGSMPNCHLYVCR